MGGSGTLATKILRRANQPITKTHLPETVHSDPPGEWMGWRCQPAGPAKPVAGKIPVRIQESRRHWLHGCRGSIVGTPLEQVGLASWFQFLHRHDLGKPILKAAELLPYSLEYLDLRTVGLVEAVQVKLPEFFKPLPLDFLFWCFQCSGKALSIMNLRDFQRRQLAIKDLELIHQASRETIIAKSLTNRDRITPTPADVLVEVIPYDFRV